MKTAKFTLVLLLFLPCLGHGFAFKSDYNASLEIISSSGDRNILCKRSGDWEEQEAECLFESDYYTASLELAGKTSWLFALSGVIRRKIQTLFLNWNHKLSCQPCGREFQVSLAPEKTSFLNLDDQAPPDEAAITVVADHGINDDMDEDGLPDKDEFSLYGCLARSRDSDWDGLDDKQEVEGRLIGDAKVKTAPYLWDTDGDGLGDAEDPKPLEPSMRESKKAWDSHWQKVAQTLGLPSGQMASLGNYESNVYPKPFAEEAKIFASPSSIYCHPGLVETNRLKLAVLGSHAITGTVYASKGSLVKGIFREKSAFMSVYCPLEILTKHPVAFLLSRYGLQDDYVVVTGPRSKFSQSKEEIIVWDTEGHAIGSIPVRLVDQEGKTPSDAVPENPRPLFPADGAEIKAPFEFQWHSETITNLLQIADQEGHISNRYFYAAGNSSFMYAPNHPGTHTWRMSAVGGNGLRSGCDTLTFHYFPEGPYPDSDGDGFNDREEAIGESNPNDPGDTPLNVICDGQTFFGTQGQQLSIELPVKGGMPPYFWHEATPLPRGLDLQSTGRISGQPAQAGQYKVDFELEDQYQKLKKVSCQIVIRPKDGGSVKAGLGQLK